MAAILNRRVLVLNQSYEPLMVIGARRAIILLLSEKVESLENYHEIIQEAHIKNTPWINKDISEQFKKWKMPFYFMDFEKIFCEK